MPYEMAMVVGGLTAVTGILMIANFPYNSFKGIDFHGRVPFVVMILVVLVFGLVTLDPPQVLLLASSGLCGIGAHQSGLLNVPKSLLLVKRC